MIEKTTNPYLHGLSIPVIRVVTKARMVNGQVEEDSYMYEAAAYTRLYVAPAFRDEVFRLSPRARDLYLVIVYNLNKDYTYVVLSYEKVNRIYRDGGADKDLNLRKFRETIKELVAHNFIDLKDKKEDTYWINPNYFFNGSRHRVFEGYVSIVKVRDAKSGYERAISPLY